MATPLLGCERARADSNATRAAGPVALAGLLGLVLLISSVGPETAVDEITGNRYLSWLAAGFLPCLWGVWLAPKVSYRRRDALIFLTMGPSAIPSARLFLKIIWRIAYLPHRDWPLRADEVGRDATPVAPSPSQVRCLPPSHPPRNWFRRSRRGRVTSPAGSRAPASGPGAGT